MTQSVAEIASPARRRRGSYAWQSQRFRVIRSIRALAARGLGAGGVPVELLDAIGF
jgi:hypothetical protein